jgi:methionyl-tRNA formyltransferase
MAASLQQRTRRKFVHIGDPAGFTTEALAQLAPRYVFIPHWSRRIGPEIYRRFECVVFHMTDLPFGRGGSPLQNLIVRGHQDTRISAIRCGAGLDAGPVYLKKDLSLQGSAEEIFLRASRVIEDMIVEILARNPRPTPQRGRPTVFKRRTPEQSDLAAARTLDEAYDLIRMLDAEGYPHAFLRVGPFHLEFTRATRRAAGVHADVRIAVAESPKKRRTP